MFATVIEHHPRDHIESNTAHSSFVPSTMRVVFCLFVCFLLIFCLFVFFIVFSKSLLLLKLSGKRGLNWMDRQIASRPRLFCSWENKTYPHTFCILKLFSFKTKASESFHTFCDPAIHQITDFLKKSATTIGTKYKTKQLIKHQRPYSSNSNWPQKI